MENLLYWITENKKTVLLLAGFLIILGSIPLSFYLVKQSQIFKSRADELKPTSKVASSSGSLTNVPNDSPYEDLKKASEGLVQGTATTTTDTTGPTPTPTSNFATTFGPTLSFKIAIEGRSADQSAKVFVGIAAGDKTTKPTYLLTYTVDVPANGIFTGLSLAGLTAGSNYTAYIKGPAQIDTAVSFTMGSTETQLNNLTPINLTSGDLNEDNTIDQNDYTLARNAYGSTSANSNWNSKADINNDGIVNNIDLAIVSKNLGKTGDSGVWYSPPPVASSSAKTSGGVGPQGGPNPTGSFTDQKGGHWFYFPPVD